MVCSWFLHLVRPPVNPPPPPPQVGVKTPPRPPPPVGAGFCTWSVLPQLPVTLHLVRVLTLHLVRPPVTDSPVKRIAFALVKSTWSVIRWLTCASRGERTVAHTSSVILWLTCRGAPHVIPWRTWSVIRWLTCRGARVSHEVSSAAHSSPRPATCLGNTIIYICRAGSS